MNTTTSELTYIIPPQLSLRETEILGTRVRAACFDALACADKSYAMAGVTFEQDGRFTKAKLNGHTVASMIGRFSKGLLLQTIRRNIGDSARTVGTEVMTLLKQKLTLPADHVMAFDIEAGLHEVVHRGSRRLTAYVFKVPGSRVSPYFGEVHIDLYACQATLTLKEGDRWGAGNSVIAREFETVEAETYGELSEKLALNFSTATQSLSL